MYLLCHFSIGNKISTSLSYLKIFRSSNQSPVPPPDASDGDCGDEEKDLPSFELIDLNSNSPTFGSTFTLDTFQSEVLVIYWALAS